MRNRGPEQLTPLTLGVVALFALLVAATYPRRERNLLKHVVFALHWTAFYLLVMAGARLLTPEWRNQDVTQLVARARLALALRRLHGGGRVRVSQLPEGLQPPSCDPPSRTVGCDRPAR